MPDWKVIKAGMFEAEVRPQKYYDLPGVNQATVGSEEIAVNFVLFPPGAVVTAHVHYNHETVILVLDGWSLTFMGPNQELAVAGPGELLYIPKNTEHMGINLSTTEPIVGVVCRSDPKFYSDLELKPHINEAVADRIDELRAQHEAGLLPKDWKTNYRKDHNLEKWKAVWLKAREGKPIRE